MCNKVGGIYTVLSTRVKTLTERLKDQLIFIGPDCWGDVYKRQVREDRDGQTSGLPVVPPGAPLGI